MADDGYVSIHRTTDAAQGELLAEMLRREGIAARFHKVSSTLIGMPAPMIEMSVDVPADSEARARELIADLEYAGAAEALDEADSGAPEPEHAAAESGDRRDDGEGARASRPVAASSGARSLVARRPGLAAGFALFLPGGAHLYARRAWTALVMAAGVSGSLAVMIAARSALVFEFAFAILIATVACDAVGGVWAARAEARGRSRPRGAQLVRGLGLLGLAVAAGGGVRFATAAPRMMQTWRLARYDVRCSDGAIVVENHGSDTREIEIANLKVVASSPLEREAYDVGFKGPRFLTLPPNGSAAVKPDVADWLARSCGFPSVPATPPSARITIKGLEVPEMPEPRSLDCTFAFALAARGAGVNAGPVGAVGLCAPPKAAGEMATGRLQPLR